MQFEVTEKDPEGGRNCRKHRSEAEDTVEFFIGVPEEATLPSPTPNMEVSPHCESIPKAIYTDEMSAYWGIEDADTKLL